MDADRLIVIMGVSGCGKSTVGKALAARMGWLFIEGDDHHPSQNVAKMAAGRALCDADRAAWLDAIAAAVLGHGEPDVVLACSALTPFVQDRLRRDTGREAVFCWIDAPTALIAKRMEEREHFMPPSLLQSQIEALSPPQCARAYRNDGAIDDLVDRIVGHLARGA